MVIWGCINISLLLISLAANYSTREKKEATYGGRLVNFMFAVNIIAYILLTII